MNAPNPNELIGARIQPREIEVDWSKVMAGAQQSKPEITHIEIRRVQNGFVIMALNMKVFEAANMYPSPQRWSFVAKDTAELGAILTSIADGSEINWLPSYDLPIIDLTRRVPPPDK